MDERHKLYQKLRRQVCSIMPFIKLVEIDNKNAKIGKVVISSDEFSRMENEFCKICESRDEELDDNLKTNFIPLVLVNTSVFYHEIQDTLNEIHQEKIKILHEDDA